VIYDPTSLIGLDAALSDVNHCVKRQIVGKLPVKQQIARGGATYIACQKVGVELLQSPGVGELRKSTIA
jgi:hypothetical protein